MTESYFICGRHRLYYQVHQAKKPKAVLIFVHGLNEHSGRYQNPINYFKSDYNLYLFDHRGHGKSEGLRSYIDSFNTYLKDLNQFTHLVAEREKGKKIFMIGHSMGGQIVINYVAKYNPKLAGFLTSSANIEMAIQVPWIQKFLGINLARLLPFVTLGNDIDPKWISRDQKVVRDYKKDPLVSKKITLKLAAEIIKNQRQILTLAPRIKTPAFLMHGGSDQICSAEGSRKFYHHLASQDKALKIYEGCYHEIFNELCQEEVFSDMKEWLEKRV